ncbi:hypothetical protein BDF19DRAFT_229671 [Syncephalis fuscata]|nr:hypothetical protein BDF19DRAFT_229671 [Syncephalis fuscata]
MGQSRTDASTREATSIDLQQVASLLGTIDQPTTTTTTTTTITTSPSISTLPNYRPAHIASHMPPLPPGYTYKHTLMVTQRLRDYGALRMESADQSRMVEESLKKLLATTNSTNTISPTDSSVQRSTADTNTSTEQHTETAEKLWSNWPLVNCEFANNRASLPDTDEFSSLPSTSTSPQLHQLSSSMNALLIPATTVLAWPTGVSTAAASGYNQHSSTHGLLSLSRMNHQKSIVNSNRFTNTKTT